jgi:chromate transporter
MNPGPAAARQRVPLRDIALTFLRVGAFGFGGGVGMLAIIRNAVVERRRWVTEEQLSVAVAFGQMLPGPFVSNYAEYIGHELRGWRGMTVAVVALLLPCLVLMTALAALYFRFGSVPVVARIFAGVQPVVVAVLAWATYTIGRVNVRKWQAWLIAAIAAAALFARLDVLLVVVGCGLLGIGLAGAWRRHSPAAAAALPLLWLGSMSGAALPLVLGRAAELALVFLKVGTVIFGGGFAAIPFLEHEVVTVHQWLSMREFIDGVALGQMTPGPVAIMGAFIGYKVLGLPGALVATLGTFLPSAFMLIGLIHVYRRIRDNQLVRGFLSGVMPAVVGMLFVATVSLGRTAISGPVPAVMAPLALALLIRFRPDPVWLILGGGLVGLIVK